MPATEDDVREAQDRVNDLSAELVELRDERDAALAQRDRDVQLAQLQAEEKRLEAQVEAERALVEAESGSAAPQPDPVVQAPAPESAPPPVEFDREPATQEEV